MKNVLNRLAKRLHPLKKFGNRRLLKVAFIIIVLAAAAYIFKGSVVAAMVNGQPISRFYLTSQLDKQYGKNMLESLIEQTLIEQEAKKEGVNISQSEIDAQIKTIEDSLKSQNTTLDEALSARGMTKTELVNQIRIQKEVETMVGKKITVSDTDIENYFTQNKDQFGKNAKLADVKDQIKQTLFQQKLNTEYQKWIDDLKAKAKVNYFVSF